MGRIATTALGERAMYQKILKKQIFNTLQSYLKSTILKIHLFIILYWPIILDIKQRKGRDDGRDAKEAMEKFPWSKSEYDTCHSTFQLSYHEAARADDAWLLSCCSSQS